MNAKIVVLAFALIAHNLYGIIYARHERSHLRKPKPKLLKNPIIPFGDEVPRPDYNPTVTELLTLGGTPFHPRYTSHH